MYPTTLSGDGAAFGNHPASSIVATTSQAPPALVDWDETERFLSLLGRSAESVDALLFERDPQYRRRAKKRMIAIANRDNDMSEYWEFSDSGFYAVDLTNEAYKIGINYIIYALSR